MIFAAAGRQVDQKRIVIDTYGGLVCLPSGNPIIIASQMSRNWVDDFGSPFNTRVVAAYDYWNGVNAINNSFIVNELNNNRPVLYCNSHHAMALIGVDYYDTPMGPSPVGALVADPWPYGPAFHPLSAAELVAAQMGGQMTFLAAVQVS